MTSQVPAAVKAADLARFAMRASQLEKAKPVISYYCTFWIVNQILSKNLHNTDEDCLVYTTSLVEKLEQFKAENQENDAVTDDMAGRAFVEQFALETLQRANNAVRANKASRQTADTFQAAATFLELVQIWGEIDPETAAKIKYAKYHALRIAKALKAGQDPNDSNPALEQSHARDDALPALDPDDAEVQMINGGPTKSRQPSVVDVPDEADKVQSELARQSSLDESLHPSRASSVPRPSVTVPRPRVEEVPDDTDRIQSTLARQSSLDQSLHPSRAPSVPRPPQDDVSPVEASASAEDFYHQSSPRGDVSPLGPSPVRKSSIGGNYFPQIPPPPQQQQPPFTLPSAPSNFTSPPPELTLPPSETAFPPPAPSPLPQTQHPHFIPPNQPGIPPPFQPHAQNTAHQQFSQSPPQFGQHQPPPLPPQTYAHPHQTYTPQRAAPTAPPPPLPPSAQPPANAAVDEAAISKAQKHARWAISALNFEDVPTAIKELRGALEVLGAGR